MNQRLVSYFEKTNSRSRMSDMDLKDLKNLVRKGEGSQLEFKLKAKHPEKIIREIVAFANTDGGTLLLGVGDDKSIPGLKFADDEEFILVQAIEKFCDPPINFQLERMAITNERDILIFTIPQSNEKPHFVKLSSTEPPKAYVRVQDRSVQASKEVKQILRRENEEGIRFVFGEKEKVLMEYLAQHQNITLEKFAEIAKIPLWLASRTLVLLVLGHVLRVQPNELVDTYVIY
ncbi:MULTISPECIES: AlbA family DNA-binding domain-containing protein [Bacteroidota]|jgi:predicted HTH transcriptional regulator|uniref:ATP-binding protein n=1 Tax=Flectobacillus rivi TaxID=2984209 RepID=A0ABT6Z6J1_9BACT|nr:MULTISPECIES: ATP-binding protein [Bacteroidota]MDI9876750.1 ATP-binding protein [Flectobacillus rivi]